MHSGYISAYVAGFFLRFEIARTIVAIAGTKNGGRAAMLAHSAKLE